MIKHISKIIIIGLLFSLNLYAQQGPPKLPDSDQIEKMVNELAAELSLNDELKVEISDLFFNHFEEAAELMKTNKDNRENHRSQMESLRQEFEEDVKEFLTDEQAEKFEEFLKNLGPQKGQRPPRRR